MFQPGKVNQEGSEFLGAVSSLPARSSGIECLDDLLSVLVQFLSEELEEDSLDDVDVDLTELESADETKAPFCAVSDPDCDLLEYTDNAGPDNFSLTVRERPKDGLERGGGGGGTKASGGTGGAAVEVYVVVFVSRTGDVSMDALSRQRSGCAAPWTS